MPTPLVTDVLDPEIFDVSLEPHVLTDKPATKTVPCTVCRRPCVVTTFMAPAKVRCKDHKDSNSDKTGSLAVVQPGRTPPEKAVNLSDTLLNKQFAWAICPFDPEHTMELKDVCHNPNYGPRHLEGYKDGIPQYRQQTGESVLHQCQDCSTLVQYSTMQPRQLRRVNEPKTSDRKEADSYESILGLRESKAA